MSAGEHAMRATTGGIKPAVPRRWKAGAIQWGTAALVAVLVLAPLLPIVYQAFLDKSLYEKDATLTLRKFADLATDPAFGPALLNTLLFAVAATILAQIIGGAVALLVGRTDLPGRGIVSNLVVWPIFISPLVTTTGWSIVYGPAGYVTMLLKLSGGIEPFWNLYSIPGMAVVAAVCQAPISYLYCLSVTRSSDAALEDSARISGLRPWRVFARITLPLMFPALLISGILNFVILIETLSIPLMFGRPVNIELLTTFIYARGLNAARPDYGLISAAALILIAIIVALTLMQRFLLRRPERFVTIGGKATRPRQFELGRWRWGLLAILFLYLLFLVLLPLVGIVVYAFSAFLTPLVPLWETWTLDNFKLVFETDSYTRAFWNSLIISGIGGLLGTALITMLVFVVHRSEFRFRRTLDVMAMLPRAMPGIIAGIGIFYATIIIPPLGWLRETIALIMIALIMRYIPLGYGVITAAMLKVDKQLDRSARVLGADWWATMRRIGLPLLKTAMVSCFVILFIHFFKDYSTAVFLYAPGGEVLGTTMLQMFLSGQTGPAAALATLQIAVTVVIILLARRISGVSLHG